MPDVDALWGRTYRWTNRPAATNATQGDATRAAPWLAGTRQFAGLVTSESGPVERIVCLVDAQTLQEIDQCVSNTNGNWTMPNCWHATHPFIVISRDPTNAQRVVAVNL